MAGFPPKKNTAFTFHTALVSQADTDIFKTSPTLAAGDITISIDGGNYANIATLPTQIQSSGVLPVALTAAEMNGDVISVKFVDASGAEWQDQLVTIITDAVQLSTITDRLPSALTANGNMKSSLVEILTTALTETSGLIAGSFKKFFNVADPTGNVNSLPALPAGDAAGGVFLTNYPFNANGILFADETDLDTKLTTLAALAATSLPNTTAGAAGGLFIAGANAATSITTALTANITGNLSGSIGSLATQAKADVNAEVVDVLRTDTIPDSVPADGAQPTIAQAIYLINQRLYEAAVVGTTLTVYKPDGTTALVTCTINDASTPTSITRAT